ncbi:LOW QUALITY PROTEIN: hypothetical protein U0070_025691, partial [Myodes glareolus]
GQDEEDRDGTTSVIILKGEILSLAEHFPEMHPGVLSAYRMALDVMISILKKVSAPAGVSNRDKMLNIIDSSITMKVIDQWSSLACNIALDAVQTVQFEDNGQKDIDVKKQGWESYLGTSPKTHVPYGSQGRDHPQTYDYIKNPQIVLLDFSLKGGFHPNPANGRRVHSLVVVILEKGISDLAQRYCMLVNITAIQSLDDRQQSLLEPLGPGYRPEEPREDVGAGAGLLEVKKIGDEYFTFITECKGPRPVPFCIEEPNRRYSQK